MTGTYEEFIIRCDNFANFVRRCYFQLVLHIQEMLLKNEYNTINLIASIISLRVYCLIIGLTQ